MGILGCHITEDHNELSEEYLDEPGSAVLERIYRAIGSKKLPLHGNILIHFDSHPDLLLPDTLDKNDVFDKDRLFSIISIENWILPAVYAGHISVIIWLKQSWCDQIEEGTYQFTVGHTAMDKIKCSCEAPYFVSEGLFMPTEDLINVRSVTLHVKTASSGKMVDLGNFVDNCVGETSSYILDLDLDYFSTQNPFEEVYSTRQIEILRQLYKYEPQEDTLTSSRRRSEQLGFLKGKLLVASSGDLSKDPSFLEDTRLQLILELVAEEKLRKERVDPTLLHEHGCTFDISWLPHHISSPEEISLLISEVKQLLLCLGHEPQLITIARSSDDDYCPKDQVESIQQETLAALESIYENMIIHKHYLDEV